MSRGVCSTSPRKFENLYLKFTNIWSSHRIRGKQEDELERTPSTYKPLHSFRLEKDKSYKQQYADMYFLRLTKIKPALEQIASVAWADTVVGGEPARRVDRVLDIRQGELCWVTGTVYMDMSLKPNILEDVSKDVSCRSLGTLRGGVCLRAGTD